MEGLWPLTGLLAASQDTNMIKCISLPQGER